jgi:RNA polymerase sigma-70 factor (ECF subfamily)
MSKQGDSRRREQVGAAYDQYAEGLYRLALLITADPAVAEDAVQQVFGKLMAMAGGLEGVEGVEGYLRRAIRNESYRLVKAHVPEVVSEDFPALLEPIDARLESADQRRAIEGALRRLTPEQREMIHLKVYEGRTFQEIGQFLDIPLNTAASRYRYATEKLRELLSCLKNED